MIRKQASVSWWAMLGMRAVIVLVSAIDVFWAIKVRDNLIELNPMGRWLMSLDSGDVALFMACKLVGTVMACWLMGWLYCHWPKKALVITGAVMVVQLLLLVFFAL